MGIVIYARWNGQTEKEESLQYGVPNSGQAGHVGYLHEAYHGKPYATRHLVAEAFQYQNGVMIQAAILRERLPETLRLAEERERTVHHAKTVQEIEPILQSYTEFVELCERIEAKTGWPVRIFASW
jgi:hypothetical protein